MNLKRLAKILNKMSEDLMDKKMEKDDIKVGLERMGFQEIQRGVWIPKDTIE